MFLFLIGHTCQSQSHINDLIKVSNLVCTTSHLYNLSKLVENGIKKIYFIHTQEQKNVDMDKWFHNL
jgi:hypothetical protein